MVLQLMSSAKALERLKKKTSKIYIQKNQQLASLQRKTISSKHPIKKELRKVSSDTLSSVTSELSAPLAPIISWFQDTNETTLFASNQSYQSPQKNKRGIHPAKLQPKANKIIMASSPLKSPPCKKCPAKTGNMCRCAMKKYGLK